MKIKENKKSGFTLAEVLITLAIIGVVAALTLPTMIANHQKKVYVVQLQKAVSTLEQGFKMMMADDAVDKLAYTSVFQLLGNANCGNTKSVLDDDEVCEKFRDAWKKYFNISQIAAVDGDYDWRCLNSDVSGGYVDVGIFWQFADGMYVIGEPGFFSEDNADSSVGGLVVDVNGLKGPNTWGRDVFVFNVYQDGTLEGAGDGTKESCLSCAVFSCTSYLMNNGWVMDY